QRAIRPWRSRTGAPSPRAAGGAVDRPLVPGPTRARVQDVGADGGEPLEGQDPWRDQLSALEHDPAVTRAVARRLREQTLAAADGVYHAPVDRFRQHSALHR